MHSQKILIRLLAFDCQVIDKAAREIIATARRTNAQFNGPIPLPTYIRKITVNRSPHVYKKSREQFEIRTHARLIIIIPTPQTIDALMKLELASGVEVEIKLEEVA